MPSAQTGPVCIASQPLEHTAKQQLQRAGVNELGLEPKYAPHGVKYGWGAPSYKSLLVILLLQLLSVCEDQDAPNSSWLPGLCRTLQGFS